MYHWTRPYIALPVHGEPKHLDAHSKLAQSSQVPITKILDNGICLKIAPNKPEICGRIKTGKMIVEGYNLYNSDIEFISVTTFISQFFEKFEAEKIAQIAGKDITFEVKKQSEASKISKLHANISKAEKLLGWSPKTSLEEGLKKVVM